MCRIKKKTKGWVGWGDLCVTESGGGGDVCVCEGERDGGGGGGLSADFSKVKKIQK